MLIYKYPLISFIGDKDGVTPTMRPNCLTQAKVSRKTRKFALILLDADDLAKRRCRYAGDDQYLNPSTRPDQARSFKSWQAYTASNASQERIETGGELLSIVAGLALIGERDDISASGRIR